VILRLLGGVLIGGGWVCAFLTGPVWLQGLLALSLGCVFVWLAECLQR
jgi:hypothetical protein